MFLHNDKIYFTRADLKKYLYQYFEKNPYFDKDTFKQWPTDLIAEYSETYLYNNILKRYNKRNSNDVVMVLYNASCTSKKGYPLEKTYSSRKYCCGYDCNKLVGIVNTFLESRASRSILRNRSMFNERESLIWISGLTKEIKTILFQVIKDMVGDSKTLIKRFPTDVIKIEPVKDSFYNSKTRKLKAAE